MAAAHGRSLVLVKMATAVALATGLDVLLAAAGGWTLRAEVGRTVAMEAVLLLPVAVLSTLVLELARRLGRGAGVLSNPALASLLAGAVGPLALRGGRAARGLELALLLGVALVLVVVVIVYARRRSVSERPRLANAAVAALGILMLVSAIALPLNGRSMLRVPKGGEGGPATAERPSLLLVVLDTMRADHLGLYGYPRPTSPWLDRFAERAIVFETAISASSWTLPAHATLFTGLFPRAHGADIVPAGTGTSLARLGRETDTADVCGLSPAAVTLAELAARAGMETGAICANSAYLHREFGLDQGFDTYVDAIGSSPSQQPVGLALGLWLGLGRHAAFRRLIKTNERSYLLAPEVNALALRWIEARREQRFFLFLNYMDTHVPRMPPAAYLRLFPAALTPAAVDVHAIRSRTRSILPAEREGLVDVYDASVRYVDAELQRLFTALDSQGLLEHTVILIVGDHGESLGEHHEIEHANGVYASEVRVPLLLRLSGQLTGRRVHEVVHLADVLPTLVDLLGLEPAPDMQGASLLDAERRFPAVSSTSPYRDLAIAYPRYYYRSHHAIYREPWVLISRSDGERELYDFRADPRQERDLAATHPAEVADLSGELARFDRAIQPRFEHDAKPPDDETRRRLRALGYLH